MSAYKNQISNRPAPQKQTLSIKAAQSMLNVAPVSENDAKTIVYRTIKDSE